MQRSPIECNKIIFILIFFLLCYSLYSQTIINPNYGQKSHPTLKITKIELKDDSTKIFLSIENQIDGGWFCADKHIYIQTFNTNIKFNIQKSQNIPVCPENHKFKLVGETLNFVLSFSKLPKNTRYVDLIEDCSNACFSFKGIILDDSFNQQINAAFGDYSTGKPNLALAQLEEIINNYPDYPYSFIIHNGIKAAAELKYWSKAKYLYHKLLESDYYDKNECIEQIKKEKFFEMIKN